MRDDLAAETVAHGVINGAAPNMGDKGSNQYPLSVLNHLGEKVFINL